MRPQGFSFPPPPPPPPTAQQLPAYPTQHGQSWGGRVGSQRGRGRGQGHRGRGGHAEGGRAPPYPPHSGFNYQQPNYGGYHNQPVHPAPYMPPSPYTHGQSQGYQNARISATFPTSQFPQPVASAGHHHLPYNTPPNHTAPYPTPTYMQGMPAPAHGSQLNNQSMMGGMPWGGDMPGQYTAAQSGQAQGSRPQTHGSHGPKTKPNQKRDHSSAFDKPQNTVPRPPAAPAVPSFGNPLPSKPPPTADATGNRKTKKRKRKHNQLGLTPNAGDHESSEDEEAENEEEESKLARAASNAATMISYKGITSTLKTPAEIAAWLAERRKRYPKLAQADERKKAAEEAEAARQQKIQEQQVKRMEGRKQSDKNPKPSQSTDAQRKEEIRRSLEREQHRIAKAVAEADAARLRLEALQKEALSLSTESEKEEEVLTTEQPTKGQSQDPVSGSDITNELPARVEPHGATPAFEPELPTIAQDSWSVTEESQLKPETSVEGPTESETKGMEYPNHGSDWTSSDGSDSGSETDSDSDSAPEQASSRRMGPERVPPPPREGKRSICRYFARNGHCNRGDQCKFLHEASEKGPKARPGKKPEKESRRKGLYQALLDRQREDEDHRAMEVISYLGQNNLLQVPDDTPKDEGLN